jgi:hypothetical protein
MVSKKRRIEVARKAGLRSWEVRRAQKDKAGLSLAGKIGGARIKELYGVVFFSIISHKRKHKRGRNSYVLTGQQHSSRPQQQQKQKQHDDDKRRRKKKKGGKQ